MTNGEIFENEEFRRKLKYLQIVIVDIEKKNLSTKEKNDEQMIQEIIKKIEEVERKNI